jgi:hypothetical protein
MQNKSLSKLENTGLNIDVIVKNLNIAVKNALNKVDNLHRNHELL